MRRKTVSKKKINFEKINFTKIIALIVCVAISTVIIAFSSKLFGEESVFNKAVTDNEVLQTMYVKIPSLIRTVEITALSWLIGTVLKFIMSRIITKSKRGITIIKLVNSFIGWIIGAIALVLILSAWGADPATLIASAGLVSLIIGLGAQSLIADIIAGLFIVIEGEYQVDDIVIIDDWRGTVQEIGIRTTKIVDAGGNIKIINNSEIKSVINQTQELSVAKARISIEYGESIPHVEIVIRDNIAVIKQHIPAIVEGPFYKGIEALSESSVDMLFFAKCKEEDLYQVQRDLTRELKLLFDANNINIPFPQVVVNQPTKFVNKTSDSVEAEAREFLSEQKELWTNSKQTEDK